MPLFGTGTLGSLIVKIETDLAGLNKGLTEAQKKINSTSGAINQFASQAGRQMTIAGAAITGAVGFMVKEAVSFEDAFAVIKQI